MAADLAVRERIPTIVGLVGSDIALTENDEATVSICELADVTAQDTESASCTDSLINLLIETAVLVSSVRATDKITNDDATNNYYNAE